MSQTSIPSALTVGFAGMKAEIGNDEVRTYVNAEASAEMPFGIMLAQGSGDTDAELPAATSDILIGVLLHSHAYDKDEELGDDGVLPDAALSVLTKGRVWVTVEEAVVPGDRAHIRIAGTGQKGAFRKSYVAAETIDATGQVRFLTTAAEDGLALVEIDMMNLS